MWFEGPQIRCDEEILEEKSLKVRDKRIKILFNLATLE